MITRTPLRPERRRCRGPATPRLCVLLTALTLLAPVARALAEEPAPAAEKDAAEPPAPVAIPLAELSAREEQARLVLSKATATAAPRKDVLAIAEEVRARLQRFETQVDDALRGTAKASWPQQLLDLDFSWTSRRQYIRARIKTLTDRLKALDEQVALLDDLEATWSLTLEKGRAERATPAVLERAQSILREAHEAQETLKARSSAVLDLRASLSRADDQATEVLQRIAVSRTEVRGRLIARDRKPLWTAIRGAENLDAVIAGISTTIARDRDMLAAYLAEYPEGFLRALVVQTILFLGALYAVVALRRRVRARHEETDETFTRPYEPILTHPFSAALLIALLPTRWLHPFGPPILSEFYGLVLLVPLLFLLPALLGRRLDKVLFVFAAFYTLDRAKFLFDAVPIAERLMVLGTAILGFVLVAWFGPPPADQRGEHATPGSTARAILVRIALGAIAIAIVANILGYFTLARVIGEGLLDSAYSALLLYAGTIVLTLVVAAVLHGKAARRSRIIRNNALLIEQRSIYVIGWAAAALWLLATLRLFTLQDPVINLIHSLLEARLSFGAISFALGDVLGFVFIVWLARWIARSIRFVLEEEVFPRTQLGRGVPAAISAMVQYLVLLIGFVFALGAAGFDLSKVTLLAGAFGVGIGFGLQNVVNNFTSGLVLLFERPIQVGDAVQVGELFGEIRRIGLRSSTLRTFQGAEVILPNANLISDQVVNWTLSDRQRRIELPVGVEYGTDPETVIRLLVDVAKAHPDVMSYPEPGALFTGFGDSSLDFELRAWTANFDSFLRIKSELAIGINNALRDAGITIPFPQRDLHVRSVDPEAAGRLSSGRTEPPAREPAHDEPAAALPDATPPPRSFNRN